MTDKEKLIDLYKRASETGYMPNGSGLCFEVIRLGIITDLDLFKPTSADEEELFHEDNRTVWWGAESQSNPMDLFTPLRETVLCFLIAMCEDEDKEKELLESLEVSN